METLADQIDRFVRWFFNSSPDKTSIEPRPPDAPPKKKIVPAKRKASSRNTGGAPSRRHRPPHRPPSTERFGADA
jgi:hypothetical protein